MLRWLFEEQDNALLGCSLFIIWKIWIRIFSVNSPPASSNENFIPPPPPQKRTHRAWVKTLRRLIFRIFIIVGGGGGGWFKKRSLSYPEKKEYVRFVLPGVGGGVFLFFVLQNTMRVLLICFWCSLVWQVVATFYMTFNWISCVNRKWIKILGKDWQTWQVGREFIQQGRDFNLVSVPWIRENMKMNKHWMEICFFLKNLMRNVCVGFFVVTAISVLEK